MGSKAEVYLICGSALVAAYVFICVVALVQGTYSRIRNGDWGVVSLGLWMALIAAFTLAVFWFTSLPDHPLPR